MSSSADWRWIAGSILAGIGHDLNGRVTALLGIAHVARTEGSLDQQLLEDLEEQVDQLKRSVLLLRRLPWFTSSEPRLIRLPGLVHEIVQLHARRANARIDLIPWEDDGDPPSIWLAVAPFTEALLHVLAGADEVAAGPPRVLVRQPVDGPGIVDIDGPLTDDSELGPEQTGGVVEGRRIVESLGGRVLTRSDTNHDGHRFRIEITLPSMEAPSEFRADH